MRHRVGSPLMAMLIDGHMEKGQGLTRAAYDQLLGAHFEMNKELQCKFLLTHLHEDANAAQFDWKLRSFHYGAMRKVSVDLTCSMAMQRTRFNIAWQALLVLS